MPSISPSTDACPPPATEPRDLATRSGYTENVTDPPSAASPRFQDAALFPQAAEALVAENTERGRQPVLVIDEAHLLDHRQLELVRILPPRLKPTPPSPGGSPAAPPTPNSKPAPPTQPPHDDRHGQSTQPPPQGYDAAVAAECAPVSLASSR